MWPWHDLGVIFMIQNSIFEYLTHFWAIETNHRYCNIQVSLLICFSSEYFDLSRSMTSRGHQRSNPVYLHIWKWPLGYVLQVVEISCFNHKMHNRLPYLLYYHSIFHSFIHSTIYIVVHLIHFSSLRHFYIAHSLCFIIRSMYVFILRKNKVWFAR